jgi:AcrR family transcriptional regulator
MYNMTAQPQRQRRARGSLTVEEILDAAERVARSDPRPLTIRAVATELGSSPMALYTYFSTKDELADALIDRVLRRVPIPQAGEWRDQLCELALSHGRVLLEHRWAVPMLFNSPSPGVGAARLGEAFLAILAAGGVTGEPAVGAFSAIIAVNYGRTAFAAVDHEEELPPLPGEYFPHSAANWTALAGYASEENYRRVLDIVIDGVALSAG